MLDPKLLRANLDDIATNLKRRGETLDVEKIRTLEAERKKVQMECENYRKLRTEKSSQIGKIKSQGGDIAAIKAEVDALKAPLADSERAMNELQAQLDTIYMATPNILADDVPDGSSEDDNVEVSVWGEPKPFEFDVKDHVDLGQRGSALDFETGSKIAGSRFTVMRGDIARLHRALIQFMISVHVDEHGYEEVNVPFVVNQDSLRGTGQLPKFEEDLFKLNDDREFYLIPTAEVPVTNIYRNEILSEDQLPIQLACHSPCFRSEAGSYGRDTRGMIRQHQFEKVELVQFVKPEESMTALENLTQHAENILQKLGLPYRKVVLCGGDIGFSSTKTYDLEVWLPSQEKYREISSCSSFGDFQARRMKARYRNKSTGKAALMHTINGSGLAIGRTLVAVLENYQNADGSVSVPEALQPLMGGKTEILSK